MFARRMVAVLLCAALLFSSAYGQAAPPPPKPGAAAVVSVVKALNGPTIRAVVGGNNQYVNVGWQVASRGGRLATKVFPAIVAAQLISDGLNWFYEEAKKSTGTSLDTWYETSGQTQTGQRAIEISVASCCGGQNFFTQANYSPSNQGTATYPAYMFPWGTTHEQAKTQAKAIASERLDGIPQGLTFGPWVDQGYNNATRYYTSVQSLPQHLDANPQALEAIRTQVLPQYMDAVEPNRVSPYPGFQWGNQTNSPVQVPTQPEWDGYEDDEAAQYPYPNPQAPQDPLQDPDLDAIRRELNDLRKQLEALLNDVSTEPRQVEQIGIMTQQLAALEAALGSQQQNQILLDLANQKAEESRVLLQQLGEIAEQQRQIMQQQQLELEGLNREATQAQVLAETQTQTQTLTDIKTLLEAPSEMADMEPFVEIADPEFDLTPLDQYQVAPEVQAKADPAYQVVMDGIGAQLDTVYAAAQVKFPFGITEWAVADLPAVTTGDCPTIQMSVAGQNGSINFCDNPLDNWMTTSGRAMMGALLTIGFILLAFNIVTRS